jgi:hypothetical protein
MRGCVAVLCCFMNSNGCGGHQHQQLRLSLCGWQPAVPFIRCSLWGGVQSLGWCAVLR